VLCFGRICNGAPVAVGFFHALGGGWWHLPEAKWPVLNQRRLRRLVDYSARPIHPPH